MEIVLKQISQLSAADFEVAPIWVPFCEPNDVYEMVKWGWSEGEVRNALDKVGWDDDHFFPLPAEAAESFARRQSLFRAMARTPGGTEMPGYCFRRPGFVNIFFRGTGFPLAANLPSLADEFAKIAREFLLPLSVVNQVTRARWELRSG